MAVYDDVRTQEQLRVFDRGVEFESEPGFQRPMSYRYGDITSPFIHSEEPLMIEDRSFVQAAKLGTSGKADGLSGIRVVATMEAAQRSLEENRSVDLAELYDGLTVPPSLDFTAPTIDLRTEQSTEPSTTEG